MTFQNHLTASIYMFRFYIHILVLCVYATSGLSQKSNLLPIKLNHKWGYIDEKAKVVITPEYEFAEDFNDGAFAVTIKAGKSGLINKQGKVIIKHLYDEVTLLAPGYFLIQKDSVEGIADTTGRLIYDCLADDIFYLKNSHFLIQKGDKYGLLNGRGKLIIPVIYDSVIYMANNAFHVILNNKHGISDSMHKLVIKPCYKKIYYPYWENEAVVFFTSGKQWGFATLDGKYFCDTIWTNYRQLGCNFIYCSNKEKNILYSIVSNKDRTDSINADIIVLSKYFLKLSYNGKFGLVDSFCKIIIPPIYDDIYPVSDCIFTVLKNGKWAIANAQGKIKTNFKYDEVFPYNSFFCLVNTENYWGIIDKTASEFVKPIYTKIDQMEKIFKLYDKKGGLKILYYNKQGDITDNESYQNVETIKIGIQGYEKVLYSTSNLNLTSKMYNKFGWYQDSINRKWGLKDSLGKWVLSPRFSSISVYDSLNLTKVELEINRSYFSLGDGDVEYNAVYGIVNHKIKKLVLPVKYVGIQMSDFMAGTNNAARFVKENGTWGLVAPTGKIILENVVYIGPFSCGLARVFEKGKIIAGENGWMYNNPYVLDDAYKFVQKMPGKTFYARYYKEKNYLSCVLGKWSYINQKGEKAVFDSVTCFSYAQNFVNNTAIVQQENKFGLLSTTKMLLPFDYINMDYLPNTDDKLISIEKLSMRYGFIKKNGVVLSFFKYQSARDFNNGFAAVFKGGRWGFIDTAGKEITTPTYSKVKDFSDGMAAVFKKGKWGFINESGEEVIECKYKAVGNFSEGLCSVVENRKWGFIDASGSVVIKCEYNFCEPFCMGYAVVTNEQGQGLINRAGDLIIPCKYQTLSTIDKYGYCVASKNHKFGIIDAHKDKIVPFHYKSISSFKNGYALINSKKGFGYIDSTGSVCVKPKYFQARMFNEGMAAVRENGKWFFINTQGVKCFKVGFTKVKDFSNGYAVVTNQNKSTFINKEGISLMSYSSGIMNSFSSNGLALIKKYRKAFFVNSKGIVAPNARFDNAQDFSEELAFVCKKGKWGLINKHGLFSVTYKYEWAKGFKEDKSIVRKNKLYGICDTEGNVVVEPVYDYVGYTGNETFRIEDNEKLGYLKVNGAWIWNPTE